MSEPKVFDETWAILELLGRHVIAGRISSVAAFGTELCRVDVPPVDGIPGYTKFFGGGSIYAVTPTDEESALHAVRSLRVRPIEPWVIPARQLPASVEYDEDGTPVECDEDGVPF